MKFRTAQGWRNSRAVTTILYLNDDWGEEDGGELHFPELGTKVRR